MAGWLTFGGPIIAAYFLTDSWSNPCNSWQLLLDADDEPERSIVESAMLVFFEIDKEVVNLQTSLSREAIYSATHLVRNSFFLCKIQLISLVRIQFLTFLSQFPLFFPLVGTNIVSREKKRHNKNTKFFIVKFIFPIRRPVCLVLTSNRSRLHTENMRAKRSFSCWCTDFLEKNTRRSTIFVKRM